MAAGRSLAVRESDLPLLRPKMVFAGSKSAGGMLVTDQLDWKPDDIVPWKEPRSGAEPGDEFRMTPKTKGVVPKAGLGKELGSSKYRISNDVAGTMTLVKSPQPYVWFGVSDSLLPQDSLHLAPAGPGSILPSQFDGRGWPGDGILAAWAAPVHSKEFKDAHGGVMGGYDARDAALIFPSDPSSGTVAVGQNLADMPFFERSWEMPVYTAAPYQVYLSTSKSGAVIPPQPWTPPRRAGAVIPPRNRFSSFVRWDIVEALRDLEEQLKAGFGIVTGDPRGEAETQEASSAEKTLRETSMTMPSVISHPDALRNRPAR